MAVTSFANYRYVSSDGDFYKIRASNVVVAVQPTTPVQTGLTNRPSVNVGRSARERGVKPREILLSRSAGSAPNIKTYYNRLPVFVEADVATLSAQATITIDGVAWTPVGVSGESIK